MPEPNLLPLNLNKFDINKLSLKIPELPTVTCKNLMEKYGLDIRKSTILLVIVLKCIYVVMLFILILYFNRMNLFY